MGHGIHRGPHISPGPPLVERADGRPHSWRLKILYVHFRKKRKEKKRKIRSFFLPADKLPGFPPPPSNAVFYSK